MKDVHACVNEVIMKKMAALSSLKGAIKAIGFIRHLEPQSNNENLFLLGIPRGKLNLMPL